MRARSKLVNTNKVITPDLPVVGYRGIRASAHSSASVTKVGMMLLLLRLHTDSVRAAAPVEQQNGGYATEGEGEQCKE